ncbi:MAG: subclass B3 metallo-beta-lactamase [Sphingomonas sp.]|nr:subclass B3 metallo-beta-lactamase [Sphingomonas sp.]
MAAALAASAMIIGGAASGSGKAGDDPLTRPIAAAFAARWLAPQPPKRIYGNTYLVGFRGMNVALIDTGAGLILIDAALPQSVAAVEANIRALGFALRDVKLILSTEPHYDHAGGLAALARDTGATVVASAEAAAVLRRGRAGADDPQFGDLPDQPAVTGALRIARDGQGIRLGRVTVLPLATPGHTPGSMSWRWQSCEGGRCLNMVFAASLNPVSAAGYRFSAPEHLPIVASLRRSIMRIAAVPCDVLFTAHPDNSGGDAKFVRLEAGARPNPFVDPAGCRTLAARQSRLLDERLTQEGVPAR